MVKYIIHNANLLLMEVFILDFRDTISEILNGLTGDSAVDINYLKEQSELHKNDENAIEILRALGRKMFEILPEDEKTDLCKIIGNTQESIDMVIQEAIFQLKSEHNVEKAEKMFCSVIKETSGMFKDDEECEYHCFENPFQEVVYKVINNPEKNIRRASFNYTLIYYMYGYCLIENGRLDEAETALKTAHRWNPVSSQVMFELAEVYKSTQRYEEYLYWTKKALKYAATPDEIARAYRNLGFYYTDMEKYSISAAMYYFSMAFEKSKTAYSELFYISNKTGSVPEQPDAETVRKIFEDEDIQYGANDDIVSVAVNLGMMLEKDKNYESAVYCYSIAYSLTDSEFIKDKIDNINELIKGDS